MRLLIVDDDAVFLQQLGKYLLSKGLSVDAAEGGRQALEMMEKEQYDVVILDLKMPDMPGVEVMRRAHQHGVHSKFIIVTGYGEIETAVETMKLGASDYIQKPFDVEELLDTVRDIGSETDGIFGESVNWLKKVCSGKKILLITEIKPEKIEENCEISADRSIWLENMPQEGIMGRKKTEIIMDAVDDFTTRYENASVIHGGISHLMKIFGRNEIQKHLSALYMKAKERNFQVVVLYNSPEEKTILQSIQEMPFSLNAEEIARVFKNPTRRGVIQLLDDYSTLGFTEMMEKLGTGSSDLSFHLRMLTKWDAIEKNGRSYRLTHKGRYFADLLRAIVEGQYRDKESNVIYMDGRSIL